ncbi:uncharacterized protein [Typha latifolia]|uniref:uncharacterized protein n=1 Tax=Typha latifolia TaxID=4733 RepID=UPI003C2DCCE8
MDNNNLGQWRKPSSSKRGRKSNSDKLKQPQRGIGVAKLEWIRLQNEIAGFIPPLQSSFHSNLNMQEEVRLTTARPSLPSSSVVIATPSSLTSLHPSFMMAYGGTLSSETGYSEFRSLSNRNEDVPPYEYARQTSIIPLFGPNVYEHSSSCISTPNSKIPQDSSHKKIQQHGSNQSMETMSTPSNTEELDLELRL